jgi:radical SAM superfamily enzyme YgiQ (UPF0313 family)
MLPTVCLIIPPSVFLLDERVFMTLGILKVAAVLEKEGYPLEVIDLSGIENYEEAVQDHLAYSPARIFGITSTTPQLPATMKIARVIRQECPAARIILGGPHVTLVHTAFKKEQIERVDGRATHAYRNLENAFDVLVSGDGEDAIFYALGGQAPKLVDANDRKSTFFLSRGRLDQLPFPARHLVDVSSYHYSLEGRSALSLIAQLGCPFECGFCGGRQSPMLRGTRTRSTENIIQEMREIVLRYGITGFMFYDDELNVNPKMVELMQAIHALGREIRADFRLRGFVKAELFNDQQAEWMVKAGFRWLLTGFESGSPRILTNINKRATREQNTRSIEIARRHGLKVKALMSIGHPGESYETVMETRDWLLQVKPDEFDVTIITTYPGTPYYDFAARDKDRDGVWVYTYEKTGDRLYSYEVDYNVVADYYKGDPDGGYKSYVFTDHLAADDLVELRGYVERDVRQRLDIPFNPSAPSMRYEHSMGQFGGRLPAHILRSTAPAWNVSPLAGR